MAVRIASAWRLCAVFLLGCGAVASGNDHASVGGDLESVSGDSLRLGIEAPAEVPAGEPVPLTLRVENVSGRSLDLYLRGRTIAFDLVVSRSDGSVLWRRLEGEVVPAILRIETLEPDGALELTDTWDQRSDAGDPVPPAVYAVRGELLTEGEPLVSPQSVLRISPD